MALLRKLYIQVLIAIVLAIALGLEAPALAVQMKPIGDGFIALLKMMLGPIIFCSVVLGLTHVRDMRQLGALAGKSLLYFETLSTVGMVVGMVIVNVFKPGVGLHAANLVATKAVQDASVAGGQFTAVKFFLSIIPNTMVDAFAKGDILQVLLVSLLVGAALSVGVKTESPLLKGIEEAQGVLFRILGYIMRLAPLGAFGAMSAAVGAFGAATLAHLAYLVIELYAASAFFVIVVLGSVCAIARLSLFKLLRLIGDEIMITLGTASGESVLPRLMFKLEQAGCDRSVVGFVLPAGYSFNLDGTGVYMAIAVGFIAQATDTPFSLAQQAAVLAVMLLTSKGGTTVAGGAFVKLAGTLQTVRALPLNALGLLFGVDRFNATCIATTNVIGNVVATFVIAQWEGAFDRERFEAYLAGKIEPVEPAPH